MIVIAQADDKSPVIKTGSEPYLEARLFGNLCIRTMPVRVSTKICEKPGGTLRANIMTFGRWAGRWWR